MVLKQFGNLVDWYADRQFKQLRDTAGRPLVSIQLQMIYSYSKNPENYFPLAFGFEHYLLGKEQRKLLGIGWGTIRVFYHSVKENLTNCDDGSLVKPHWVDFGFSVREDNLNTLQLNYLTDKLELTKESLTVMRAIIPSLSLTQAYFLRRKIINEGKKALTLEANVRTFGKVLQEALEDRLSQEHTPEYRGAINRLLDTTAQQNKVRPLRRVVNFYRT